MDTGVLNRLWKKSNIYGGGFRANTIADKSHPTWLLFVSWNAANDGVTGIIEMIGIRSGIRPVGRSGQPDRGETQYESLRLKVSWTE